MTNRRTDLDIPEGTVWPASDEAESAAGGEPASAPTTREEPPVSLDADRDTAERNAAAGGWEGASEQIENDFEAEQLRRGQREDAPEDVPLT
jgi:hypothetical protein